MCFKKSLFKELLTALVLLLAFLAYLYTQNNLFNFIDYAILGIGEFGSKNWATEGNIFSLLLFLLLPIMTLVSSVIIIKTIKSKTNGKKLEIKEKLNEENKLKIKETTNKMLSIFAFSICAYIIVIPILNVYHVYLASILMIINLMYIIDFLVKPIIEENSIKNIINTIILCIIILLFAYSAKDMWNYAHLINYIPQDSPFYGAIIDPKMRETIEEVGDYVQNNDKDTIVLSTYAPLISLYLNDLDNGDYDLPLRGNLGSKGEKGLIEQIKELSNTQILILHEIDEEKEIYQFVYDVADYIKQNYTYVGQVNKFDIYEIEN